MNGVGAEYDDLPPFGMGEIVADLVNKYVVSDL
jgi:hypothetical protein